MEVTFNLCQGRVAPDSINSELLSPDEGSPDPSLFSKMIYRYDKTKLYKGTFFNSKS